MASPMPRMTPLTPSLPGTMETVLIPCMLITRNERPAAASAPHTVMSDERTWYSVTRRRSTATVAMYGTTPNASSSGSVTTPTPTTMPTSAERSTLRRSRRSSTRCHASRTAAAYVVMWLSGNSSGHSTTVGSTSSSTDVRNVPLRPSTRCAVRTRSNPVATVSTGPVQYSMPARNGTHWSSSSNQMTPIDVCVGNSCGPWPVASPCAM